LNDSAIGNIIDVYTEQEKGVRNLKRCLETIYKKINLRQIQGKKQEIEERDENVTELLKSMIPKTEVYSFYS